MRNRVYEVREEQLPTEVETVIRLFEHLAEQEGWQPGRELREHVARSYYFTLVEVRADDPERLVETMLGGLQLVHPDFQHRLPCHAVWSELPDTPDDGSIAHILVLAVLPISRKKGRRCTPVMEEDNRHESALFWRLCLSLWRYCVRNGIREVWMEATPKMFRAYRFLGMPLIVHGSLREHWGEPVYPCSLSLRSVAGALAEKALQSSTYRDLFLQALSGDVVGTERNLK